MSYEEFKEKLLEELHEHYGELAEAEICVIKKNNGKTYDGVQITMGNAKRSVVPVISLDGLYEEYSSGSMDIRECAEAVCRERKRHETTGDILKFAVKLADWDAVKDGVFPILLSTQKNEEMLKNLVSTQVLDLSVVYIFRMKIDKELRGNVKISRQMIEHYGITESELHRQAMENLAKDGYEFLDMAALIRNSVKPAENEDGKGQHMKNTYREDEIPEMYVLTNKEKSYGAVGILNKKFVREFAKGQNFFILPSSIHETIFVPADNLSDGEIFDNMVEEVNEKQVSMEERLSNHCYFYDGQADEIRMCA